jgi:hypothetical protein
VTTKIATKKLLLSALIACLLFASMNASIARADSGVPSCETSTSDDEDNEIGLSTIPNCTGHWAKTVFKDYMFSSLGQIKLKRLRGHVKRIIENQVIDLTGKTNWLRYDTFAGKYRYYIVGAEINFRSGAAGDKCGFILNRTNANNYFAVMIDPTGAIRFQSRVNDVWVNPQYRSTTLVKAQGRNVMYVAMLREYFFVFVNGQHVATFEDATRKDIEGAAGISGAVNSGSPTFGCSFYRAWIYTVSHWEWR